MMILMQSPILSLKTAVVCLFLSLLAPLAFSQVTNSAATNAPGRRGPFGPVVKSPEVSADRKITFRILAAKAESVRLNAGDIQGLGQNTTLTKGTNDVWEITVGPVASGSYRYSFNVDGLTVIDPRNPLTSESNANTWSLLHVPGSEFQDTRDVPHGAVAEVTYYSKVLGRFRRLHVYTPAGYASGKGRFPIFYLLHGASDSDNSWSTIGRSGFILDNLIAEGKAVPMIVVMPAGHTQLGFGPRDRNAPDPFLQEFQDDIMPFVEARYRVKADRKNRAMAGLSMGGGQTLNIGFKSLEKFGYLGVFSSGVFGIVPRPGVEPRQGPSWEEQNKAALDDAKLKKGLKLVWFGTGKDDFLLETSRATVAMLKKHQFDVVYHETEGGHTWLVWRDYLRDFAPLLFR